MISNLAQCLSYLASDNCANREWESSSLSRLFYSVAMATCYIQRMTWLTSLPKLGNFYNVIWRKNGRPIIVCASKLLESCPLEFQKDAKKCLESKTLLPKLSHERYLIPLFFGFVILAWDCHPIWKICTVFLSSYRNTRESLGERERLWENELRASASTAFSPSSPKLSRVLVFLFNK